MTYCVQVVQGPGQKSEQKHRTKNFAKLPNHLPLLIMIRRSKILQHYVLGRVNDFNLSAPSSLYNICAWTLQGIKAKITFGFALISAR